MFALERGIPVIQETAATETRVHHCVRVCFRLLDSEWQHKVVWTLHDSFRPNICQEVLTHRCLCVRTSTYLLVQLFLRSWVYSIFPSFRILELPQGRCHLRQNIPCYVGSTGHLFFLCNDQIDAYPCSNCVYPWRYCFK